MIKAQILKRRGQHARSLKEGLAPQRSKKSDLTMSQMAPYMLKDPDPNSFSNITMVRASNLV